ncbi:hypothetical protein B0T20DRAFT_345524 [Sordaria brevicollis]|uniref:Uncharacterized protein n=1 Tax=Sordaria brevicollis TaxID=83679 RepID=A0AAE0PKR8_SORBR|nr:hypothetical protein B0T20DRAFT_345524 [Sordaria brevicollis]
MSRRPSVSSGEPEPSAPVLPAAHSLASPSQSATLPEGLHGERSNGTPLALLGDNIGSSSPANGQPKVEHPKTEAVNSSVSSPPDPFLEFMTKAKERAQVYCESVNLKSPSSSKSTPVTHPASLVSEADNSLAQLENNKPANNNHSNVVNHNHDQHNEASILELIWDLVLGFIQTLETTLRTVVFLISLPFLIVKQTARQTASCGELSLRALYGLVDIWIFFGSHCLETFWLITKKVGATAKTLRINGSAWALQVLPWSKRLTTELQRDEGLAVLHDTQSAMAHDINTSTEVTDSVPASEEASPVPPIHPRFVSTAQNSEYWAGRFSTTHDKLLDELLQPHNLKLIIDAHTIQSEISNDTDDSTSTPSVPPASAFNNPSTSVYASTRIVPTRNYNIDTPAKRLPDHEQLGLKTTENRHTPFYMRGVRRIPHSATTDAVMQTPRKSSTYVSERNPAVYKTVHHDESSYQQDPSPSMIPRRVIPRSESSSILPQRPLPETPVSESSTVLPRRPLPRIPHVDSEGVIHIYAPDSDDSYPSESFRMRNTDRPRWLKTESQIQAQKEREAMLRRVTVANAAALTDDDDRCRRVFLQLEECCTTDEARNSLHVFQQAYARRHNREDLLPKGGTMHDPRTFRNSVFSRGLFGSRRSMGSLPPRYGGDVSRTGLNVDLGQYQSEVRSWKAERSLLQVPRRVFSHNRSVSMKFDGLEPSSNGHRLERYGTVRGVPGNNEVMQGQYQHRTGFM